jgi:uncharacterized protein involved in response to NO
VPISESMRILEPSLPPPMPHSRGAPLRFALWNLGFRPFYLLASSFAALSIALWVAQYGGYLPTRYLPTSVWHGHELIFGFTMAVMAGFLLTAVRAWTNQPTPTGMPLLALALLWIAGRVLVLLPYALVAAIVNAAFPAAVALAIAVPLVRSGNRRNYFFVGLLLMLSAIVLTVHLSAMGLLEVPVRGGLQAGLDIVVFIMAVIGGRVIPMFTNNGVPNAGAMRVAAVEKLALGSLVAVFVADVVPAPAAWIATLAAIGAIAHAVRLCLWRPWRTLGAPLVWILHAAYAWIVIYLALRALAAAGLVAEALAIHALTVGAIGGLTLGMMTRTARGHTGRPLVADSWETACFVLVQAAAVVRVFGGLIFPAVYALTVAMAGVLWSAAFALYAVRYWPVLTRARLDGKPG